MNKPVSSASRLRSIASYYAKVFLARYYQKTLKVLFVFFIITIMVCPILYEILGFKFLFTIFKIGGYTFIGPAIIFVVACGVFYSRLILGLIRQLKNRDVK